MCATNNSRLGSKILSNFCGGATPDDTLDAPYWLRWAKEYRDGEFYGTSQKRSYPSSTQWFREQQAQIIPVKWNSGNLYFPLNV